MAEEKVFNNIDEVNREFFPNSVLDRLEEKVRNYLGLKEAHASRLNKDEGNPLKGTLEFALGSGYTSTEEDLGSYIRSFFKTEGYEVKEDDDNTYFQAKKNNIPYRISVRKTSTYWVSVRGDHFEEARKQWKKDLDTVKDANPLY